MHGRVAVHQALSLPCRVQDQLCARVVATIERNQCGWYIDL